jgi:MFS family permease
MFEFAGMAGVLGGLGGVAMLPATWSWPLSLVVASSPILITLALAPRLRRWFPDQRGIERSEPVSRVGSRGLSPATAPAARSTPALVWLMFGVGIILGLLWSSMTQFLIPVRGAREFGLDRASVSRLLAIAHVVDLVALLPFGWFADRIGRPLALSLVLGCLAFGAGAVGLGPFPLFVTGSALLGLGMAGWVFPLAMIREHTEAHVFPRRTGFYRVGVDAAAFLGPLLCGLIGEAHTGLFAAAVGAVALAAAFRLGWLALR